MAWDAGQGGPKWRCEPKAERKKVYLPSPFDISSFSLSSSMISSSLLTVDRKSSSESMPVTGVGGAGSGFWELSAAVRLLLVFGASEEDESGILASAAFRFRVMGGILSAVQGGASQEDARQQATSKYREDDRRD